MSDLFESLSKRLRPEDVACLILAEHANRFSFHQRWLLTRVAAAARRHNGFSSMSDDFQRPAGLPRQLAVARDLFTSEPVRLEDSSEPSGVSEYISHASREIHKVTGKNNFKADRLSRSEREALGMEMSRRRYNKLFRHLGRMEKKVESLKREWVKYDLRRIGNAGFAHSILPEEFSSDDEAACFVAYYTARSNMRSEFTVAGQKRAYDEVADMLFRRCADNANTKWSLIARVYTAPEVLAHLSDHEKGEMLGQWFGVMQTAAKLLKDVWSFSKIDRKTMIVKRGNDSTTWNETASAFNKARSHWINLLHSVGAESMLETICPGKVLRLMAADVVAMHRTTGSDLNQDTLVWSELPLPWEVVLDGSGCTLSMVRSVCTRNRINGEATGWIAPLRRGDIAHFEPTPELVHGVTVGNPYLAFVLRRAGYFSGKPVPSTKEGP